MMRKRNNHRGHSGEGGGGKFKPRGKYGHSGGGGNGGGRGSEANAAKTIARATSMREKYMNLARDAMAAGDRIAAENWYQHADHYYRVIRAAQEDQEEFERYVNRPQPQGFEEEQPNDDIPASPHLPAFLAAPVTVQADEVNEPQEPEPVGDTAED